MVKKQVVWDELAVLQLESQLDYIKEESVIQAEKVRESILEKTAELSTLYERHPKDKYKTENDETYRAFEIFHYRISYRITPNQIRIVRFRTTYQNPKEY